MYPILFHIYGPIFLHTYSVFIALGIFVFLWRALQHPLRVQLISYDNFSSLIIESAITGIIGARLLHVVSDLKSYANIIDVFKLWDGGLAILGGFIGAIIYAFYYLLKRKITVLPIFDFIILYLPLAQSIGRIGCFFAGCCHGSSSYLPWAIKYTNSEVVAPLNSYIHPTQLYSSFFFIVIFIVLKYLGIYLKKPGQLTSLYIMLMALERFFIDFLRGDRILSNSSFFSFYQLIALALFVSGIFSFIIATYFYKKEQLYS